MASDDENFYTYDSGLDVEKEFDHDGTYDGLTYFERREQLVPENTEPEITEGWQLIQENGDVYLEDPEQFLFERAKTEIRKRTVHEFRKAMPTKSFSAITLAYVAVI